MQEQEPTVNDILSSIRQILSNKIEDGDNETMPADEVNETTSNAVDEQEQALMQATDVYVLMPDMRISQEETHTTQTFNTTSSVSSTNDMPYEQPMIVQTPQTVEKTPFEELQEKPQIKENLTTLEMNEADVKPMIQAWLDKNLPALVERIVAEEVRRIFNKR